MAYGDISKRREWSRNNWRKHKNDPVWMERKRELSKKSRMNCKDRINAYAKKYRKENGDKIKKDIRDRYLRTKQWVLDYKGKRGCKFCLERNPVCLDFHHKNSDEKEFDILTRATNRIEKMLKEIEKCEVVCANCHRKIHGGEIRV